MKKLLPLIIAALFSSPAFAGGEDTEFASNMLVVAKTTGMCGTIQQMVAFQKSTQMPGGDEFIQRFASTEAARLGWSLDELLENCENAIKQYSVLQTALDTE